MALANWQTIADIVQSLVTVGALVVGGIWAYRGFIRERLSYSRIEAEPDLEVFALSADSQLLHASIRLRNTGQVACTSRLAELRLRKVVPAPAEVVDNIDNNIDPVKPGEAEIDWPVIAQRSWSWSDGAFEIEPGEADTLHADFGVLGDVEVVELYFFLRNEQKRSNAIGWTATRLFRIK